MSNIINTHYVQLLLEDTDRRFDLLIKGEATAKEYRYYERDNLEKALEELRKR